MTMAIEVLYRAPHDPARDERLTRIVRDFGGRPDYLEVPAPTDVSQAVCLTYVFDTPAMAENATSALRDQGEHVQGPFTYS